MWGLEEYCWKEERISIVEWASLFQKIYLTELSKVNLHHQEKDLMGKGPHVKRSWQHLQ